MKGHLTKEEMEYYCAQSGQCVPKGSTWRFKHLQCDGGNPDHKERLYITLKENGGFVGYCHNCGKAGFRNTEIRRLPSKGLGVKLIGTNYAKTSKLEKFYQGVLTDNDGEYLYPLVYGSSSPHNMWLKQYFNHEMYKRLTDVYGVLVLWEKEFVGRAIYFPMMGADPSAGTVLAQARHLVPGYTPPILLPKWMTIVRDNIREPQSIVCLDNAHDNKDELFIVEDRISSIKLSELGYAAVCLRGTHLSDETLMAVAMGPWKRIIIWLDNDFPDHIEHTRRMANRLVLFSGASKEIIRYVLEPGTVVPGKSPKDMTEEYIARVAIEFGCTEEPTATQYSSSEYLVFRQEG